MSERPSFPNSAMVRAPEWTVLRKGRWQGLDLAVRYARFRHPSGGVGLVDTGYSRRTTRGPRSWPLQVYAGLLRPRLTDQILPAAHPDVDVILLTHLHADHVSALKDYPRARIVAHAGAIAHFQAASSWTCLRQGVFRELLPGDLMERVSAVESLPQREAPLGLGSAGDVFGDGAILAVPLPGHMHGHTGYLWTGLNHPLLYAGDAQWLLSALMQDRSPGPPARWIMHDARAARDTARRIAAFAETGGEVVLCHDPAAIA